MVPEAPLSDAQGIVDQLKETSVGNYALPTAEVEKGLARRAEWLATLGEDTNKAVSFGCSNGLWRPFGFFDNSEHLFYNPLTNSLNATLGKGGRQMPGTPTILIPCKISKGMFRNERWIRIPPPDSYYEPSINGWVPEEMLEDPGTEHNDEKGERSGFVEATVLGKAVREGEEGILIALGGELNFSDGVFLPNDYLHKHGIKKP